MKKCTQCDDSGIWETGNNDLPCSCPAGKTAMFNTCEVDGPVTGEEVRRHFLNGSPDPINGYKTIKAEDLPGRKLSLTVAEMFSKLIGLSNVESSEKVVVEKIVKSARSKMFDRINKK